MTSTLSHLETPKSEEESSDAAAPRLEARVSEEELVTETQSSNPSGAILSLALGKTRLQGQVFFFFFFFFFLWIYAFTIVYKKSKV